MTQSPFPEAPWGNPNSRLVGPLSAFASTRPGSWLLRTLTPLDRRVLLRSRGRYTLLGPFGTPTMVLTTRGARSGLPRSSPLLYCRDGEALLVIGSNFGQRHHPAWTANLRAHPEATVTMGGREIPVLASELAGPDRDRAIEQFLRLTPAYAAYRSRTDRELRVFRLQARRGPTS